MLAPNSIGARPPSSLERPASAGRADEPQGIGLHRTFGVDEIDTQISQETLENNENS